MLTIPSCSYRLVLSFSKHVPWIYVCHSSSDQVIQPGGHLFLSTISRTPLAYFLTIFMAEVVQRKVAPGTHTYSKFIKPSELIQFFETYQSPASFATEKPTEHAMLTDQSMARNPPWITRNSKSYLPRTQAEVRGLIYNPIPGNWILAPKDMWGTLGNSYIFWVRKPVKLEHDL